MSSLSSSDLRSLVVEAVAAGADVIADAATADRWEQPSALEGMTVGALCAHLVRAAGATIAYLDRTPVDRRPDGELLTPVTYFRAAVEAPIHNQIRDVSADEAAIGPLAMAAKCRQLADDLASRFADEPEDRLLTALGGRMLTLDDFCRTRLIEVLLHLDDLTTSTGVVQPEIDPRGPAEVVDICMGIGVDRHGVWGVLAALARAERSPRDVFPIF
jgi:hypothetical protein